MSELDQLRQEAEQLKNQIRVSNRVSPPPPSPHPIDTNVMQTKLHMKI